MAVRTSKGLDFRASSCASKLGFLGKTQGINCTSRYSATLAWPGRKPLRCPQLQPWLAKLSSIYCFIQHCPKTRELPFEPGGHIFPQDLRSIIDIDSNRSPDYTSSHHEIAPPASATPPPLFSPSTNTRTNYGLRLPRFLRAMDLRALLRPTLRLDRQRTRRGRSCRHRHVSRLPFPISESLSLQRRLWDQHYELPKQLCEQQVQYCEPERAAGDHDCGAGL